MQTSNEILMGLIEMGSTYTAAETAVAEVLIKRGATFEISKTLGTNTYATYQVERKGLLVSLKIWFRVYTHSDERPDEITISLNSVNAEGTGEKKGIGRFSPKYRFQINLKESEWGDVATKLEEKLGDWESYARNACMSAINGYKKEVEKFGTREARHQAALERQRQDNLARVAANEAAKERLLRNNGLADHPKAEKVMELALSLVHDSGYLMYTMESSLDEKIKLLKEIM